MEKILSIAALYFILSYSAFGQAIHDSRQYLINVKTAEQLVKKGEYPAALQYYEAAFKAYPRVSANDYYNAACAASLTNDYEKAKAFLELSIDNGFWDKKWMVGDKDLDGLKSTAYWNGILKKIDGALNFVAKDFAQVNKYELLNLIPFKQNGKWGYLEKSSNEIVVPANYKKVHFGGDCLKVVTFENKVFNIDADGGVNVSRMRAYPPFGSTPESEYSYVPIDETGQIKGFVCQNGRDFEKVSKDIDFETNAPIEDESIEDYPIGSSQNHNGVNTISFIKNPFKIEEKWYAVARKNNRWSIIDENGNNLKGFDFKFKSLKKLPRFLTSVWFYYEDNEGKGGFVNTQGEKAIADRLNGSSLQIDEISKIAIVKEGENSRLVDLLKMEFISEPIKEKIVSVDYTFDGNCDNDFLFRLYVKEFFILVKNGEEEFYIDCNNKKYIPIK